MKLLAVLVLGTLAGAGLGYAEAEDVVGALIGAVLGIVAVVIFRPDRASKRGRNPRSGTSRFVVALLVLVALVLVAIAAVVIKGASDDEAPELVWRDASVALQPVSALKGVALGQSLEEVTARLGRFDLKAPATAADAASPGREYQQAGGPLRLRVEEGRVRRVSYECQGRDSTRVNRIACNDPPARILEVFGGGARQLCAKVPALDPAAAVAPRVFVFDVLDTGTRYVSVQGEVKGFIVMSPADLERALGGEQIWQRCS